MDARLVQLLGSFITARNQYALMRLEFAMNHPKRAAPPVIDRLSEASGHAMHAEWPGIEAQLENALEYAKRLSKKRGSTLQEETAYALVGRSLREMDQYARAIRWVLTVTESEDP